MIDFIFGDAGSGKSTYLYEWLSEEAIKHPDKRYYLFVPEQNTLKAQREMIMHASRKGMLNVDVLSFQLFAYRVMEELGIEPPVILDDVSKSILIRKSAIEAEPELQVYKSKINSSGFVSQLKNLITELCQYNVDTEKLMAVGESVHSPLLRGKISDICNIYSRFRQKLDANTAIPEDISYILLSVMERSHLLDHSVIAFDGYTGFTPIQLSIIEHLITKAEQARFSITIPMSENPYKRYSSKENEVTDMYWLSRETIADICILAEKNNIQRSGEIEICSDRPSCTAKLVCADNPEEEVKVTAREICRDVLLDGERFQKIGVALADPSSYNELLKIEMIKEGIPFFMDDRSDGVGSPVIEFVRSSLAMISSGFRYDDVMSYLRNPLINYDEVAMEEVDILDNLMRKRGLRGKKAFVSMELNPGFCFQQLFDFDEAMKSAANVRDMTEALKRFCVDCKLRKLTEDFSSRMEKENYLKQAAECRRFTELLPDLFERMCRVLGDEKSSVEEYRKLLDAGFREMKGGLIPETMDMVLVGDLKRSRFDDIDVLYVLGANDGLLPSTITGGGIFTDFERTEIQKLEIDLAPDDKTDSCIQRFYLKLILNKPTKKLVVSYSKAGRDGKAWKPSSVLDEMIQGVYGDFDQLDSVSADSSGMISSVSDALGVFAELAFSRTDRHFYRLYKALSDEGHTEKLNHILGAALLSYQNKRLSETAARELYGDVLSGSVTRIENYEGCPFFHFIRHGLSLKERENFDIEAVDIGNLYHRALDGIFKEMEAADLDILTLDEETLVQICDRVVRTVTTDYHDSILYSSARNKYIAEKVLKIIRNTIKTLKNQLHNGDFHTAKTEVKFNHKEKNLELYGVIDRIDCFEANGKTYVKVIDYKSGKKEFSLSRLMNGLELQLITYLDNAVHTITYIKNQSDSIIPAGMFYYHVDDPIIAYDKKRKNIDLDKEKSEALKMQGAVMASSDSVVHIDRNLKSEEEMIDDKLLKNSLVIKKNTEVLTEQEFEGLIQLTRKRMQEDSEKILAGDISIHPYREAGKKKCEYCNFHGICGFDPQISGFRYRNIKKIDKETLKSLINTVSEKVQGE